MFKFFFKFDQIFVSFFNILQNFFQNYPNISIVFDIIYEIFLTSFTNIYSNQGRNQRGAKIGPTGVATNLFFAITPNPLRQNVISPKPLRQMHCATLCSSVIVLRHRCFKGLVRAREARKQ